MGAACRVRIDPLWPAKPTRKSRSAGQYNASLENSLQKRTPELPAAARQAGLPCRVAVAVLHSPYNHRMQRVRFSVRSVPFALALTTLIAYGLLLPLTGFYWDDWPFAWIARFLGPAEFFPAFQGFRPFLAPIFFLSTSLLPASPTVWQAAALVMRFLAAWAAWWCMDQVWPARRKFTFSAALLFTAVPWVQSALGCIHPHQPGMVLAHRLPLVHRPQCPRASASGRRAAVHSCRADPGVGWTAPDRVLRHILSRSGGC